MKFLCTQCGSKYQIADEKVNGRVLRMKCRKCSHDIVIDGQNPAGPSVRPPAGASSPAHPAVGARRPPTGAHLAGAGVRMPERPGQAESVGRAPAAGPGAGAGALGAGFKKSISGRPVSGASVPRAQDFDQWHVAVNDVPVGPVSKQEVLRKMSAGAVHETSLVWREGFDDWRPLREVPELAALLRQAQAQRTAPPPVARGGAGPSPAAPTVGGRPVQAPGSRQQIGSRPQTHPHRAGDALKVAARSNVVPMPVGGRQGGAVAPQVEPDPDTLLDAPPPAASVDTALTDVPRPSRVDSVFGGAQAQLGASPPTAPEVQLPAGAVMSAPLGGAPAGLQPTPVLFVTTAPGVAVPGAPAAKRGLPVGAWIAIAGSVAFGMVLALVVGKQLLTDPAPAEPVAPTSTPGGTTPAQPTPQVEATVNTEVGEPMNFDPSEVNLGTGEDSKAGGSRRPKPSTTSKPGDGLTEEERRRIAAMSGGSSSSFGKGTRGIDEDRASGGGGDLTGEQIASVVSRNKSGLQQCYERSTRGVAAPDAIRVNVQITIGASGKVKVVTAKGATLPGLDACIEAAVRRWVFPASGGETATQFPVVFSPGG